MMKKEMSLRSTMNISKESKFPIRVKIMNIFIVLKKLKNHIKPKKYSSINLISSSLSKVSLFILTLSVIITFYYFYINFYLVPYFESTEPGLTLDFWKPDRWENLKYRKGIIIFICFHVLFLFFMISLIRCIFSNPGELSPKYLDLYSLSNFMRVLFQYIIHFKDKDYKLTLEGNHKDLYTTIKELIDMERDVNTSLELYNSANIYNSIDVTFKKGGGIASDLDNDLDFHEVANVTKDLIEDIIEPFEHKIEEIIGQNEDYKQHHNLKFISEGHKKIKRICQFCLIKKPDRTHHCRTCRRCLRKLDHHCHFLSACIGFSNYKYFILVLFYSIMLLSFMIITLLDAFKYYLNEYGDKLYLTVFLCIYVIMTLLNGLIIYFFGVHVSYIGRNNTTIETVEKCEKDKSVKDIYDKGFYENFQTIFGSNCLSWLLPTEPSLSSYGYEFEINSK